ncbi:Uncharacterised protein [Mycobacteroides abscessus subsp. abscessus]|nr:Uncharacterised protein [Mycobacteroides abscessus subsp. abscessus]
MTTACSTTEISLNPSRSAARANSRILSGSAVTPSSTGATTPIFTSSLLTSGVTIGSRE